jgi:hypothetical protein
MGPVRHRLLNLLTALSLALLLGVAVAWPTSYFAPAVGHFGSVAVAWEVSSARGTLVVERMARPMWNGVPGSWHFAAAGGRRRARPIRRDLAGVVRLLGPRGAERPAAGAVAGASPRRPRRPPPREGTMHPLRLRPPRYTRPLPRMRRCRVWPALSSPSRDSCFPRARVEPI